MIRKRSLDGCIETSRDRLIDFSSSQEDLIPCGSTYEFRTRLHWTFRPVHAEVPTERVLRPRQDRDEMVEESKLVSEKAVPELTEAVCGWAFNEE